MSSRLMDFPLAMRSLRHFPPLPSAVMGVLAEQSKTGLAGVEMEDALNTTRHGLTRQPTSGLLDSIQVRVMD